MRILPTICTHRCSVLLVASHDARGSSGSSTRSRTLLNGPPPGPIDSGYLGLPRLRCFANRLVDEDGDAVPDRLRVREPQALLVARVTEEAFAAPEDDREHHEAQLVDEVVLDQRLHELCAAVDHDVPILLLFQLGDRLRDIAA